MAGGTYQGPFSEPTAPMDVAPDRRIFPEESFGPELAEVRQATLQVGRRQFPF